MTAQTPQPIYLYCITIGCKSPQSRSLQNDSYMRVMNKGYIDCIMRHSLALKLTNTVDISVIWAILYTLFGT